MIKEEANLRTARDEIRINKNVKITAQLSNFEKLPYISGMLNLLVINELNISEAEIKRVLAPYGKAIIFKK